MARLALGVALASMFPLATLTAEEGAKTLPTLLIKGEVVSVDTNDPAATLLKVKDRYGFETPIYLSQETGISKGEATLTAADLTAGTGVEVEYNFDINTAKRHAVSVKVAAPTASAAVAAPVAAPVESTPALVPEPSPVATPEAPAMPAEVEETAPTQPSSP